MGPEEEFEQFDRENSWPRVFQQLHSTDAQRKREYSLHESKRAENRHRNRYRDVIPYDHSRVQLLRSDIDYINASLVVADDADRAYILTQGPLPDTAGHFWLMVWEQKTRAVLMLNRIIEKGQLKCHAYFPSGSENDGDDEMTFDDVKLKVTYVEERDSNTNYTVRAFYLTDIASSETREVLQFHYTAWPDFGVPSSPEAFLDFLWSVRESGALDPELHGPPVIHCSAGIGRSGTFCLVDACLVMIEKRGGKSSDIHVREILMSMRRYRMGLVQTFDQLRFSYLAIIEGMKRIVRIPSRDSGYDNSIGEQPTSVRQVPNPPPLELSSDEDGMEYDVDDEDEDEEGNTDDDDDNGNIDDDIPEEVPPPIPPRAANRHHNFGNHSHFLSEQNGDVVVKKNGGAAVAANGVRDDSEEEVVAGDDDVDDLLEDRMKYALNEIARNYTRREPTVVRRRPCEEREKQPAEQIARMKQHQHDRGIHSPPPPPPRRSVRFYILGATVVAIIAIGGYNLYRTYYR